MVANKYFSDRFARRRRFLINTPRCAVTRHFGVLIVFLVIIGSVWIIANLNSNMMPMSAQ